jgi:hypothetical protein
VLYYRELTYLVLPFTYFMDWYADPYLPTKESRQRYYDILL